MATKFQLVFAGLAIDNNGIPILRFKDAEKGIETPSFMLDVKSSKSYMNWKIKFAHLVDNNEAYIKRVKELFEIAISAKNYQIVFEERGNIVVDGELLDKLINHLMWVEKIKCENPDFVVNLDSSIHIARKIGVVIK